MNCAQLAARIEQLEPSMPPREVARLCLLLATSVESLEPFQQPAALAEASNDTQLRLQAATDQHAAMTEELESLARSDPRQFTPDQTWILVRALKVQSQVLQLYVGRSLLEV